VLAVLQVVCQCPRRHADKEETMAKFMVRASYTTEGGKGLQSGGGTSRRDAVAAMAEGLGGSLESFYFAFGETDAYVVMELPDNETAAAASIAVNAAGGATSEVVVLLTPEEIDKAAKMSVDYRPPGN
jgi:uncharacterized protein with GYD domain